MARVVHVTAESHPEIYSVMLSLNQAEAREIKEQTDKTCTAIRQGMTESETTEERVKKLCNATARCFKVQDDWAGSAKHVSGIKQCITEEWNKIIQKTALLNPELRVLRLEMAKRPIQTLQDKEVADRYWAYVDQTLPMDK